MIDWGDGIYEHTAEALLEASKVALAAARIARGDRVLDLGCGTGNAALGAARLGASVTAVDPATRLVEVTRSRAASEGLVVEAKVGEAGAIPAADASVDVLVSVFAVIFAPDPEQATTEMLRVVRPGGRVVVTTWLPTGPIAEAGRHLVGAMAALDPDAPPRPIPPWGDELRVRALFESRGAKVEIATETIRFEAESAEAWFAEQEANHPVWRFMKEKLAGKPEAWEAIRAPSVAALVAGSESKEKLVVGSDYLVVVATVG